MKIYSNNLPIKISNDFINEIHENLTLSLSKNKWKLDKFFKKTFNW